MRLIVLVKILKCFPIIRVILLKFAVVKSLIFNKNINTQAKVRKNLHSLFCCMHVVCLSISFLGKEGQQFNY